MVKSKAHFSISERKILLRFFDITFALEGIALLSFWFDFHYFDITNDHIYKWLITLVIYILLFGEIFEMYDLKVANEKYLTFRSTVLTGAFTTLFYVLTPIISPELPPNRIQIIYLFLVITFSISLWRLLYIYFIYSPTFFKKVLLVGSVKEIGVLIDHINKRGHDNYIVGYVSKNSLDNSEEEHFHIDKYMLDYLVKKYQVSDIIVESFNDEELSFKITTQLIDLFEQGYTITNSNDFKETLTHRIPEARLNESFYNYLTFSSSQQNNLYLYFHRLLDIICSLLGLIIFLLLIPCILIANLIGNRGSLFYFQERVGRGGIPFKIIKLRSMVRDAEKNGAVWAKKEDIRITKFGKFLRASRLDEIPQFMNILKGDMSLIGPRPERPEFVEKLEKKFPFYSIRHVIKPGLTGWAQVEYPYASTMEEQSTKLRYDLYYIKERNLLLDFKIMLKTISTVLFYKGT